MGRFGGKDRKDSGKKVKRTDKAHTMTLNDYQENVVDVLQELGGRAKKDVVLARCSQRLDMIITALEGLKEKGIVEEEHVAGINSYRVLSLNEEVETVEER